MDTLKQGQPLFLGSWLFANLSILLQEALTFIQSFDFASVFS